ncbi:olfactory receptor 2AT4-like [Chanos chanos]|uniref:Olfactory receptor n=1 Tax=Chanos chanos TaxID=29144 RepID=A0A6J2WV03_CHACN|nr:olfactory receptor 2AT4-like [Chanos chanos]
MLQDNQTIEVTGSTVKEFFVVGFPGLQPDYYHLVASLLFILYIAIVAGNTLLVVLFAITPSLQKPMYIIMLSLALSDIGFSTVALPKVVSRYWFGDGYTPFHVCLMQKQFIHYFGTLNSLIMMTMSMDRFLAICFPLRYPVLMTNRTMGLLTGFAWTSSMIAPGITTIQTSQMPFCGPNLILHCYCDTFTMNRLACADVSAQNLVSFSVAMFVLLLPFSFILFSYISIIVAVVKMSNAQARRKTFSTCGTQVCIISIYYVPRFFVYAMPYTMPYATLNADQRIALALFYSLLPPLVNPVIYCFRTKEIRQIFLQWIPQKNLTGHKGNIVSITQ